MHIYKGSCFEVDWTHRDIFRIEIHDDIFYEFTHACKSFMIIITPSSLLASFGFKFMIKHLEAYIT